MADNLTKISSTYDMVEIMKNISANYFDSDLSDQRIGMFGYITESMANIFGAAILDASTRQREYIISTARKRSTLLYEGSKYDINIDNATPSRIGAYLGVLTSSITNPSNNGGFGTPIKNDNNDIIGYKLVLEKETTITINNYEFMFEHDILITATLNDNKKFNYTVRYLLPGDVDDTSNTSYTIPEYNVAYDVGNKYMQSYVQTFSETTDILLFKVNLVQITKESTIYPIIKNDIVSLTGLDFSYSNNLSHFNIFYRKNNVSSWEHIKEVPIYYSDRTYDDKVIFYETYHDEQKIRLDITNFSPDYNSELRIDIYTTDASEPNNLSYVGNGSDIQIQLKSLDERHSYVGLQLNCKPISSIVGGKEIPTLEELRTKVIHARQTVNSLNTDYDLINYMKDKDTTNDTIFIKKENDIVERRYSCYMIPRLENKDTIPSSTLNLGINIRDLNDGIMYTKDNDDKIKIVTIKSGVPMLPVQYTNKNVLSPYSITTYYSDIKTKLNKMNKDEKIDDFTTTNSLVNIYDYKDSSNYTVVENDTIYRNSDDQSLETNGKIYGCPYTISCDIKNNIVRYYLTSLSKEIGMNMLYEKINSPIIFSIDSVNIERNSFIDDSYTITANVIVNGDISNYITKVNENKSELIKNSIILKGFIYRSNDPDENPEVPNGYIDFNYVGFESASNINILQFEGVLKVGDNLSIGSNTNYVDLTCNGNNYINDDIKIKNVEYPSGSTVTYTYVDENVDSNISIPVSSFKIHIGCYCIKSDDINNFVTYNNHNTKLAVQQSGTDYIPIYDNTFNSQYYKFYSLNDNDSDDIFISEYELINVYINGSEKLDLYTDMSEYLKSAMSIEDNFLYLREIPVIQYSKCMNETISKRISNIISDTHTNLEDISGKITNNYGIDYKFFRTYGPCKYFKLKSLSNNTDKDLKNLDISIKFNALMKSNLTISDKDIKTLLQKYIKEKIESLNADSDDYTIYISNIITDIENEFNDYVRAIELVSINGNTSDYRIIVYDYANATKTDTDLTTTSINDIADYVPEYINVPLENIDITFRY